MSCPSFCIVDGNVETDGDDQLDVALASDMTPVCFLPFFQNPRLTPSYPCNIAGPPIIQSDNRLTVPLQSSFKHGKHNRHAR